MLQIDTNMGDQILQQTFLCCGIGLIIFFVMMIGSGIYLYREVERSGKNGVYWFLIALFLGPTAIAAWAMFFKNGRFTMIGQPAYAPYPPTQFAQYPYAGEPNYPYPPYPYYPPPPVEKKEQTERANEIKDINYGKEAKLEQTPEEKDAKPSEVRPAIDRLTTWNIVSLFSAAIVSALYLSMGTLVLALAFVPNLTQQDVIFNSLLTPQMILLQVAIQDMALILSVYYHIIKPGAITFDDMGLTWNKLKPHINIPIGVIGGLCLFGMATVVEYCISVIVDTSSLGTGSTYAFETNSIPGYAVMIVAGCVFAPISEEIFFRGYAFKAWMQKMGPLAAYGLSAFFFSIVHFNVLGLLPIILAGLGLALIYHKTGSLFPGMIAHATNNFIAITLMFLS